MQSVAWPNPVTDFSHPRTDSAPWLSVPASLPAGAERRLPLGSEPDRLGLLWCPPDPEIAPEGFWILAGPISTELAADIHNHLAENRSTPVWRPETDKLAAYFNYSSAVTALSQLSILAGFYGHERDEAEAPVAHFAFPTQAQLDYAARICPPGALEHAGEDLWTTDIGALPAATRNVLHMPLQPILVRAVAR